MLPKHARIPIGGIQAKVKRAFRKLEKPCSEKKPIKSFRGLSERKITLLYHLQQKGVLTISHLHRLCYPGKRWHTVAKVLSALRQRGLVSSHKYCLERGRNRESFYYLTRSGFLLLKRCAIQDLEEGTLRYTDGAVGLANYEHRKAILDFWITLELECRSSSQYELISFIPEWQCFDGRRHIKMTASLPDEGEVAIIPDATFILRNRQTLDETLYFAEIDRSTETIIGKRSLFDRFYKYQFAFSELAFRKIGGSFRRFGQARMLFIADKRERLESVAAKVEINSSLAPFFLFSDEQQIGSEGVLDGSYVTATGQWASIFGGQHDR